MASFVQVEISIELVVESLKEEDQAAPLLVLRQNCLTKVVSITHAPIMRIFARTCLVGSCKDIQWVSQNLPCIMMVYFAGLDSLAC